MENDRRREKAAKILRRHGCERVQKSVFVANHLGKRELGVMKSQLKRALEPLPPGDSLLILPLPEPDAKDIQVIGHNNVITYLEDFPVKIIL